jgi:hypothetical protein
MAALRRLKNTLDEAYRVPGTNVRFGWDAIIGVVPWAGDVVTALMACGIVVQAHHMRVPRVVQLRMLLNVAIDLVIGAVPFFGDIADVFWKSNSKNFALLERHAANARPASAGDWLFVGGIVAAIVLVALVPLLVMYWLASLLIGR